MKHLKKFLVPVLSLLLLAGCSTSDQKAALQVASGTVVSVDLAMKEWGAYVKANHPPVAQELAVKDAFQKYQASMVVVCDAGAVYASTAGSTNLSSAASTAFQSAIGNETASIADLENLITKFGVTLK